MITAKSDTFLLKPRCHVWFRRYIAPSVYMRISANMQQRLVGGSAYIGCLDEVPLPVRNPPPSIVVSDLYDM